MRPFLSLGLCGALTLPCAAVAQAPPPAEAPTPAAPIIEPQSEVALPAAEAAPAPAKATVTPNLDGSEPTTVAPMIVEAADDKDKGKVGKKVGAIAAGVIGGVAGAAVAGPVGKVAGGFVGKRLAKTVLGSGKDKPKTEIRPAQTTPSADQAAAATAGTAAAATPPVEGAAEQAPSP